MIRSLTLLFGLFLTIGLVTAPSVAQAAGKVKVKVQVVHATKKDKKVDSRIGKVAKHLKRMGYTGLSLLGSEQLEISPKGKRTVTIAGGRKLTVAVISKDDKRVRLRVQIQGRKGKVVDTTVKVRRNGLFVVAGPRHKDGILVLPISARY